VRAEIRDLLHDFRVDNDYLAQIQIAAATNTATEMGSRRWSARIQSGANQRTRRRCVVYFFFVPRSAVARGITRPEEVATYRDALLRGPVQFGAGTIAVITLLFTLANGIATFNRSADQQANEQFFSAAQMAISGAGDLKTKAATSSDDLKSAASDDLKSAADYSLRKIALANPEYCDMVTSILLGQINANTRKRNQAEHPSFRVDTSISAAVLVLGTIPPCSGRSEPPRVCRRLFGLSYAAIMCVCSSPA